MWRRTPAGAAYLDGEGCWWCADCVVVALLYYYVCVCPHHIPAGERRLAVGLLGIGVSNGCETAVKAVQAYLHLHPKKALVKLNLSNAAADDRGQPIVMH